MHLEHMTSHYVEMGQAGAAGKVGALLCAPASAPYRSISHANNVLPLPTHACIIRLISKSNTTNSPCISHHTQFVTGAATAGARCLKDVPAVCVCACVLGGQINSSRPSAAARVIQTIPQQLVRVSLRCLVCVCIHHVSDHTNFLWLAHRKPTHCGHTQRLAGA